MATSAQAGKDGKKYLKPKKGILKASSSFDKADQSLASNLSSDKEHHMKWDEMNILATYHPPDKDYGHMKVEEPKTPFSAFQEPEDDVGLENVKRRLSVEGLNDDCRILDSSEVSKRLELDSVPKICREEDEDEEEDSSPDEKETPEEREHRKKFEAKRKMHYNEFYAMKLAKKLLEEEENEEEDEEGGASTSVSGSKSIPNAQAK